MKRTKEEKETDFAATHADEHAGEGGSYVIENGRRRLVERTREPGEKAPDPAAPKPATPEA